MSRIEQRGDTSYVRRHPRKLAKGTPVGTVILIATIVACCLGSSAGAQLVKNEAKKRRIYENVYAVCIGVDEQLHSDLIPVLAFAGRDARAIHSLFTERFGYSSTDLIGSHATREAIVREIESAAEKAGPKDVLIVYFAGHGETIAPPPEWPQHKRQGYLIAYDTKLNYSAHDATKSFKNLDDQAVNMRHVVDTVASSEAMHALLILDCCFSGFATELGASTRRLSSPQTKVVHQLLSERTCQVMTAGTADQPVLELNDREHGLFTYYLHDALQNSESDIFSLKKVHGNIQMPIMEEAAKNYCEMMPQLRQIRVSNGDWVFIDREVADEVLITYEIEGPQAQTTQQEYDEFTGSTRSASQEQSLEDDPEYRGKFEEYEKRAATGDPIAMAILQHCYEHGVGVRRDPKRSFYWAAESHDYDDSEEKVGAQALAHTYEYGIGVERNEEFAKAVRAMAGLAEVAGLVNELNSGSAKRDPVGFVKGVGGAFQGLGSMFDSGLSGKVKSMSGQRDKLSAAIRTSNADKIEDNLARLESTITAVRKKAVQAQGDPTMKDGATQAASLCDQLLEHMTKIRKFQRFGLFSKMTEALDEASPIFEQLEKVIDTGA